MKKGVILSRLVITVWTWLYIFRKINSKPGALPPGYINLAPLGLTLKPLLALKGRIIKASVTFFREIIFLNIYSTLSMFYW